MDISEKTLRDISQAVANHIEPKIYPKISEVYVDEKPCILVVFSGDDSPYFAYGRAYIRVADEDRVLSPSELENFINKKTNCVAHGIVAYLIKRLQMLTRKC
jgi:ATP-dependent DNA helicase RecG